MKIKRETLCALLIKCQKTWHSQRRNLRHAKVLVRNILTSLTWYANWVCYLIYNQSPVIHHHMVKKKINIFLSVDSYRTSIPLISFKCFLFPPKFSCTKSGVSSPNRANVNLTVIESFFFVCFWINMLITQYKILSIFNRNRLEVLFK